jgi:hypothetical protein
MRESPRGVVGVMFKDCGWDGASDRAFLLGCECLCVGPRQICTLGRASGLVQAACMQAPFGTIKAAGRRARGRMAAGGRVRVGWDASTRRLAGRARALRQARALDNARVHRGPW